MQMLDLAFGSGVALMDVIVLDGADGFDALEGIEARQLLKPS